MVYGRGLLSLAPQGARGFESHLLRSFHSRSSVVSPTSKVEFRGSESHLLRRNKVSRKEWDENLQTWWGRIVANCTGLENPRE